MSQAVVSRRGSRGFGLHHAFGVSVGAHALLAGILLLLSGLLPAEVPVPLDEPILKFTFNRETDAADRPELPRGTVPDETPRAPTQPAVVPTRQATAAAASPPPVAPSAPQRQQRLPPDSGDPGDDPDRRIAEPTDDRPGLSAPDRADADAAPGEVDPRRRRVPSQPDLDLRGALEKYRRSLERAKADRPATSSSGSHENVFVPDMSSMPLQGTPYGILEFSSRDYDWSDYYRQIYWDILKAWYRRLYATTADFEKWAHQNSQWMLNHQSAISFVIHRSGNVSDIVLHTPSGCVPLDNSALDGLSEVILVPLPADFPRESEQVRARFIATGEIANMRQYFAYLRRINFF